MADVSEQQLSEYELLRLRNIERNNLFLKELGLSNLETKKPLLKDTVSKVQKKKEKNKVINEENPVRRSSRVAELPKIDYSVDNVPLIIPNLKKQKVINDNNVNNEQDYINLNGVFKGSDNQFDDDNDDYKDDEEDNDNNHDLSFAKNVNANIQYFLNPEQLAIPVLKYGKNPVLRLSVNNEYDPRFNKYSGVTMWKNCLYLWVNISNDNNYINSFSNDGRNIIWFGGSKMNAESVIVKRLLHSDNRIGKPINNENKNNVLLFIRLDKQNYSCLGRLQYTGYDTSKNPIKIEWELIDFEHFKNKSEFIKLRKIK